MQGRDGMHVCVRLPVRVDCAMTSRAEHDEIAAAIGRGGRFGKTVRLLRHADFDRVYQGGRRIFSTNLSVFWRKREDAVETVAPGNAAAGPRVGFTVGRVLGGAVVRNRIRRRLREATRLHMAALQAPVDLVINPRKSALHAPFADLLREVGDAFRAVAQGKGSRPRTEQR